MSLVVPLVISPVRNIVVREWTYGLGHEGIARSRHAFCCRTRSGERRTSQGDRKAASDRREMRTPIPRGWMSMTWRDLQDRARSQLLVLEQCSAGLAPGAFAD